MTLPSLRDWVFSIKTYAGAILAVWIALNLDLDRPYWAMASAYIVAQPLAGAMRSKAAYRFIGTLLGAVATLVLIPNLVNAPEVLIAALVLWVGMCIYFAVLDRTPRSYLFLLAGYTVALIGLPSVDTPGAIWDVVLARVEEITLGIVCSTVIGSVVFPTALGPALAARIDAWIRDAAAMTRAVLTDDHGTARLTATRRRVGADSVEIDMLASHLAYDTSALQAATRPLTALHQRVLLLLPVITGLDDRLTALRATGGVTAELAALMRRIANWIGTPTNPHDATGLRHAVGALEPPLDARADWNAIMLSGVLARLGELVDLVHDIIVLRRQIAAGSPLLPQLALNPRETGGRPRHRDHAMALHSALAAVVAIGVVSTFWIATAWPEGAGATALAAIACAFFASQDDPAPSMIAFLYAALIAIVLDAFILFALLPMIGDFDMLVLAIAPAFLILGALMSMPATARAAGPIAFIAATQLALSSSYSADFTAYVNASIAAIVGLAVTTSIIRVVRSVGAEYTAGRMLRANRTAIARAARDPQPAHRIAFVTLMLDRLSYVVPRLAASGDGPDATAIRAMADLRVGVNVVNLQRDTAQLPKPAHHAIEAMLHDLAAHYAAAHPSPPTVLLLAKIDDAVTAVATCEGIDLREPLRRLVGIRRGLFPAAPPYLPPAGPDAAPPAVQAAA